MAEAASAADSEAQQTAEEGGADVDELWLLSPGGARGVELDFSERFAAAGERVRSIDSDCAASERMDTTADGASDSGTDGGIPVDREDDLDPSKIRGRVLV